MEKEKSRTGTVFASWLPFFALEKHVSKSIPLRSLFALTILGLVGAAVAWAQSSYMDEPGIPAFTTAFPVEHGFISLNNGNLHIEIPVATYPQRGNIKALHARLVYDSRFWSVGTEQINQSQFWQRKIPRVGIPVGGNFRLITDGEAGNTTFSQSTHICP